MAYTDRESDSGLMERVIAIRFPSKVTKGGRSLSVSALVAIGNGEGRVGIGYGKARGVPMAIEKANKEARIAMTDVYLVGDTVGHEVTGEQDSAHVLISPASPGTGVKAGATVRAILEVLGVRNVLIVTGDHMILGDHPDARSVFDLDSVSLLQTITMLMDGKDLAGNDLEGTPTFFPGACVSPGLDPVEPQLLKMEKKIDAGARFFQTQAVYDPKQMEDFMRQAEQFRVPVLAGIVVLKSAGMARFMNNFVAGVFVPDHLIKEIAKYKKLKDQKKKGAEIAGRLIREMKHCCQGAHIMPLGWTDTIDDILAHAEIA